MSRGIFLYNRNLSAGFTSTPKKTHVPKITRNCVIHLCALEKKIEADKNASKLIKTGELSNSFTGVGNLSMYS